MEPKMSRLDSFFVLGVQLQINPKRADYCHIWEKSFTPYHGYIRNKSIDDGYYGVYFPCATPEKVDFVAGMAVKSEEEIMDGLVLREIPASYYAIFECSMDQIGSTWGFVYATWLKNSDRFVENPVKACFEYFPAGAERTTTPVLIHIPVIERSPDQRIK